MQHRNGVVLCLIACAMLGVGCGDRKDEAARVIIADGEQIFPGATLTDWVSYAVQLSELRILSEEDIPPPASVLERREGYIGRRVTAQVGATHWKSTAPAPMVPDVVTFRVSGHVLKGDERVRFAIRNSPRIEVNGNYMVPLVYMETDQGLEWNPLTTDSVFEVMNDPVATADVHAFGNNSVARTLSVKAPEEIQKILQETEPHAGAKMFWNLPPLERLRAARGAAPK